MFMLRPHALTGACCRPAGIVTHEQLLIFLSKQQQRILQIVVGVCLAPPVKDGAVEPVDLTIVRNTLLFLKKILSVRGYSGVKRDRGRQRDRLIGEGAGLAHAQGMLGTLLRPHDWQLFVARSLLCFCCG